MQKPRFVSISPGIFQILRTTADYDFIPTTEVETYSHVHMDSSVGPLTEPSYIVSPRMTMGAWRTNRRLPDSYSNGDAVISGLFYNFLLLQSLVW